MIEVLKQPWPWYISGPLIGLMVPLLFILGNKSFGISSSCGIYVLPAFLQKFLFFQYNWKKESWNLFFVTGILVGGMIATKFLMNPFPIQVNEKLATELAGYGITDYNGLVPNQLFNWQNLLSIKGFILMVVGGFLVGFGTRYAGGCTSGHAITGLSTLQWPSLVATCCFMLGGFIMANCILPFILSM